MDDVYSGAANGLRIGVGLNGSGAGILENVGGGNLMRK